MRNLAEEFHRRFEVVHARTPELRRELYRMRYDVICRQLGIPGFEPWRFPDGEEKDGYDERSAHCFLRHRPTRAIAGAVRLVLRDPRDLEAPFPLEAFCTSQLKHRPDALDGVPRRQIGEISRLFVARQFADSTDAFPYPVLGLLKGVFEMSAEHGVTHLYAMMEPQLNRLLRLLRLDFEPIGPVIDCHGRRQPHMGAVRHVLARARRERPRAWEVVTGQEARPVGDNPGGPGVTWLPGLAAG